MSGLESLVAYEDSDPIDIAETLAEYYEWQFERLSEEQIEMVIEAGWKNYSVSLEWSFNDENLRLSSSFEMNPPDESIQRLYHTLNLVNSRCWSGFFLFLNSEKLMSFRSNLNLSEGFFASTNQVNNLLKNAIMSCEKFYPAFQLAAWGGKDPDLAIDVVFEHAMGSA